MKLHGDEEVPPLAVAEPAVPGVASAAELADRLRVLHARTAETPSFNPVFQLSLELSRLLENGGLDLAGCERLIAELECDSMNSRARRLRRLVAPTCPSANIAAIARCGAVPGFESFQAKWERPCLHLVFTGHPTFLLGAEQSAAIARAATADDPASREVGQVALAPDRITLDDEHRQAMRALVNAQDARDTIVAGVLEQARGRWPHRWLALKPFPFSFATWVGYDMDGRTDIGWAQSLRFRLAEKAERLGRYAGSLTAIDPDHALIGTLRSAADYAAARAADFAADLSDAAALAAAANALSASHPDKLLSLAGVIDALEREASTARGQRAVTLKTLASAMRADGLAMGSVHFRVNARQLHNAVRRLLGAPGSLDLASKGALVQLRKAVAEARPLRSNLAAVAMEGSTAIRQFLAIAQIIRHIDADQPVRMLIAECEQPATVLGALYLAKLFGVADKVDVSPLFETERALEHGGRVLDVLFGEPEYQAYARQRGRVTIQTGFSDAGRFIGQIPASLSIERLQARLAEAMRANGLADLTAIVFNTHGESMGRGAHPHSLASRFDWSLTPWAQARFADAGVRLDVEVSFQGGDGYLFFASPRIALATLTRIAELRPAAVDPDAQPDPFYLRTDVSLDLYRAIKDHQRQHLESRTYARAVNAFGLGLLRPTGSRVSRRQAELGVDRDLSLRQIRAIPHNAILQQLGYPVNVLAGLGAAAEGGYEEVAALLCDSDRGRELTRFVRDANAVASIKTLAAYGELFDSAFWASRPYRGTEDHLSTPCATLAGFLIADDRTSVFRRLASSLRVDALKLHRLLALLPEEPDDPGRVQTRRAIGVCHAIRLALFQHMFLRAASIPAYSRINDIAGEEVLEMVLSLRIDDALALLRRAYPANVLEVSDFDVTERTDYPRGSDGGYGAIRHAYIDPIERAYALALRLSTAIANHFGAHG